MLRKTLFWLHLGTGVAVGLIVAMLSFTGVLLTYERQLIAWADSASWPTPVAGSQRQSVSVLIEAAEASGVPARRVTYYSDTNRPVLVGGGRRAPSTYVQPHSGEVLGQPENAVRNLMGTLTRWHRWFDAGQENRDRARWIVGVANVAFLFLLISGAYLWLPKFMRWSQFRMRLRFASKYPNAKTRDFYWHHIFAAWSFLPLVVIIVTGVIISFEWAHHLLERVAGDAPAREFSMPEKDMDSSSQSLSIDALLEQVMNQTESWNSITINLPNDDSAAVRFDIDYGSGRQPQKRETLILHAQTGW